MISVTYFIALLLLTNCAVSYGEIEKLAIPSDTTICFHWWPKLVPPVGWHHDREASIVNDVNALVPDGSTFSDAVTVMYAEALYKPRLPDTRTVAALVADDQRKFLADDPGLVISSAETLKTADGQSLLSFTYFPKEEGNWERVAYGEEGDFFLIFVVSSRSPEAFKLALSSFEQLITQYRAESLESRSPGSKDDDN